MSKTNRERILHHLRSISPEKATNHDIREDMGIRSHQQVYQITQGLLRAGLIQGGHRGREWVFWVGRSTAGRRTPPEQSTRRERPVRASPDFSYRDFENLARRVMSTYFGVPLVPGRVPGVPKEFDMVSPDAGVVGDAKYLTLVRGQGLPSAKFSVIAEHVWLLEKSAARVKFLVFGNQREVPEQWLARYGSLVSDVAFYFLTDDGQLEHLAPTGLAIL